MFIALWAALIFAPRTIAEIKEGDCLTFADMQTLVGVQTKDVYLAGEGNCRVDYPKSAEVSQLGVCREPLITGYWQRNLAEDKKFGVYFPWSPPCFASVTEADFINYHVAEIFGTSDESDSSSCAMENLFVDRIQTEKFRAKKWEAGEGYIFLPNPLVVRDERYSLTEENGYVRSSCAERKLIVSYTGWGSFESNWWEFSCDSEVPKVCRHSKMKSSENKKGETCILVKTISNCQK